MPKASEVANELRKLADALDQEPAADIPTAYVDFYIWTRDEKNSFLNIARMLPRPVEKIWTDEDLKVQWKTKSLCAYAKSPRNVVCTLIEPAKAAVYDCEPLLSVEETASLGVE
jgi:hypothetical protein